MSMIVKLFSFLFLLFFIATSFINIPAMFDTCAWRVCPDAGIISIITYYPNFYIPAGCFTGISAQPQCYPSAWHWKLFIVNILISVITAFTIASFVGLVRRYKRR